MPNEDGTIELSDDSPNPFLMPQQAQDTVEALPEPEGTEEEAVADAAPEGEATEAVAETTEPKPKSFSPDVLALGEAMGYGPDDMHAFETEEAAFSFLTRQYAKMSKQPQQPEGAAQPEEKLFDHGLDKDETDEKVIAAFEKLEPAIQKAVSKVMEENSVLAKRLEQLESAVRQDKAKQLETQFQSWVDKQPEPMKKLLGDAKNQQTMFDHLEGLVLQAKRKGRTIPPVEQLYEQAMFGAFPKSVADMLKEQHREAVKANNKTPMARPRQRTTNIINIDDALAGKLGEDERYKALIQRAAQTIKDKGYR